MDKATLKVNKIYYPFCSRNVTKCDRDNSEMKLINLETKMPDPEDIDFNCMTEGQMADYMAAEKSGEFGNWAVIEKTYKCPTCGKEIIVQEV
ncbi:MAG: hypothetical protein QXU18_05610 [Thermoplasmatales archaeon]